jgi:spore germination protein KC
MKKIVILLSLILLISGCYDYRELNDMSVVTGIGIDYKDNEYIVSLEITKSIKDGSSNEIETVIYTGSNKVLADAFLEAKNMSDKYVYMEHVNVLLVSEELCNKGIGDVIDYIVRDTTINSNYYMVVTKDINKVLGIKQDNDSMSNVITNTINYYLDDTSFDDLDIMSSYMINKRIDIGVPYISLEEDKVIFYQIAYFNRDKIVGTIDSKLYTLLKLNSSNVNFSKNGNTISIYNNSVKYEVKEDTIIVKIDGEGLVKEVSSKIDLENKDSYEYLSRIISKDIKLDVESFINSTLSKGSDLLGLEDKYYKKYKRNMKDIKYQVDVDIKINKNGIIYGVLYDK